jgi:hypothetical protein
MAVPRARATRRPSSHHTHDEDDEDDAAVPVGAEVGVGVGVGVWVGVDVSVGVGVEVCVAVRVTVEVCVAVCVTVEVCVPVRVGVEVCVAVRVGVGVRDWVGVGVGVSAGERDVESEGRGDSEAEASDVVDRVALREGVGSAALGRSDGRSPPPPPQAVRASPSTAARSATRRAPATWGAHVLARATARDDLALTSPAASV